MLIGMLKMPADTPVQKICVPQNMKPDVEGQLRREGLPLTGITYFAANDDLETKLGGCNSCIFAMLQGGDSRPPSRKMKVNVPRPPKLIPKLQELEDKFNLIIVCDEVHRMINGGDVLTKQLQAGEQLNPNWKEDVRCFKSFLKLNFALLVGMTATNLGTSQYLRLLYEEESLNIKPGSVHNFHYTKLESLYAGLTVPVTPTKGLPVEWLKACDMKGGLDYCMSEMEALWKSRKVFNLKDQTDEAWEKWKSYTGRQNFCRFYISTASAVIYSCVIQRLRQRYLQACEGSKAVAMALSPWQNTLTLCDAEYNVFLSACIMSWLKESPSFVEANYGVIEEIEKRIEKDVLTLGRTHRLPRSVFCRGYGDLMRFVAMHITKASYASWSSSCFSKEYARGWTGLANSLILSDLTPHSWRLATLRSWVQPPLRRVKNSGIYSVFCIIYRAVKPRSNAHVWGFPATIPFGLPWSPSHTAWRKKFHRERVLHDGRVGFHLGGFFFPRYL